MTFSKKTLQLLLLTLLSSCNLSHDRKDMNELNIKGEAKTVTESTFYEFSFKEAEGGDKIIIEDGDYKSDDINQRKTWLFNGDGNIKEESKIIYKDVKYEEKETREYDMMGRLQRTVFCNTPNSVPYVTTYEYPFMSKLLKRRKYGSEEITYKYDDKGNEIESCNPLDGIIKTQYTYNSKGWLTNKIVTDSSGIVVNKIDYDLDADGKLMYETIFYDGKEFEKKEYLSGVLRKLIRTQIGGGYEDLFNDKEDLIIHISFRDEKHLSQLYKDVYQYEYDKNGNWTMRIKCNHWGWRKAPVELTIREIKY